MHHLVHTELLRIKVKRPPSSRVISKGAITIPLKTGVRPGLKEGDRTQATENPFEPYIGALPLFKNRQQISDWVASLRDDKA